MKNFILSLFVLGALAVSAAALYAGHMFLSAGPLEQTKIITIPKGSGVIGMAQLLKSEQVIADAYVFAGYAKLTGTYKTLQAGEYEFPAHIRMTDALAKITRGEIYRRAFTIPEGKTSFEIIKIINAAPNMKDEVTEIPAEGSLLPNTYDYQTNESRKNKIELLQQKMQTVLDEEWAGRETSSIFKTPQEALTLASIVEKETGIAAERARIAGVFINRLKINMPLQSDPTVIYGINKGENKNEGQGPLGRRLLSSDLETQTPYNTYLNTGLPPGPICNPGRAAIAAVLHPENNEFLYFVADGRPENKGGHVFAKTLTEHNQNVADWRALRRSNP